MPIGPQSWPIAEPSARGSHTSPEEPSTSEEVDERPSVSPESLSEVAVEVGSRLVEEVFSRSPEDEVPPPASVSSGVALVVPAGVRSLEVEPEPLEPSLGM